MDPWGILKEHWPWLAPPLPVAGWLVRRRPLAWLRRRWRIERRAMELEDSLGACREANASLMVTLAQLSEAGAMVTRAVETGNLIPSPISSSEPLPLPGTSTGSRPTRTNVPPETPSTS
jgi:hypothetical protein